MSSKPCRFSLPLPLMCMTLFFLFGYIYAEEYDIRELDPKIINAELKPTYVRGKVISIKDLTNNVEVTREKADKNDIENKAFEIYKFIFEEQEHYLQRDKWSTYGDADIYGVTLHPNTFISMQKRQGAVYNLVHHITGPIAKDKQSIHEGFESAFKDLQTQLKILENQWETVRDITVEDKGQDGIYFNLKYTNKHGFVETFELGENQNMYDLIYYRLLQLSNNQNSLTEFEAKIKAQDPFMTIKDGGVKRCQHNVPLVYCSRGFPFLGTMDSNHPHYKYYKVTYAILYGEDTKPNDPGDETDEEFEKKVPEPFIKELPFHRLNLTMKEGTDTEAVVDFDDNGKELTYQNEFFYYYKQVAQAQAEQRNELLAKRQRKEVPIIVRKDLKNPKLYWEFSQEGAKLRKITEGDPDYDFAADSDRKIQATNEQLRELRAALESKNVHIEGIITNLAETPFFMINQNPEKIGFQDPRYEVIRPYYLNKLREGATSS